VIVVAQDGRPAAVDGDARAGHERGLVAGEVRGQARDVGRRPEPADRIDLRLLFVLLDRRGSGVELRESLDEDLPGHDRVDPDVLGPEVDGHRAGQPVDAALCDVVGDTVGIGPDRVDRRHVDDAGTPREEAE